MVRYSFFFFKQNVSFITIKVDVEEHGLDVLQNWFPNLISINRPTGKAQVFPGEEEPLYQMSKG